ncbi:MAG: hypothetical protein EOO38_06715 [Cytophagaceae bacterium]|nr:MAG: hypothetical protein EOO38_06715 [Cytophagaceae bacterium]
MANLTLKDREYKTRRFDTYLHRLMAHGHTKAEAIGILLLFWDTTRAMDIACLTETEALEALPVAAAKSQQVLQAMRGAGYLKRVNERGYSILGNQEAIAHRDQLREYANRPRKKRKKAKVSGHKVTRLIVDDAPLVPEVYLGPTEGPKWTPSAKQPERTPLQQACHDTWMAYAQAYEQKVARLPLRNAKTNALIKQLVQRIGQDRAPLVAKFYVEHQNDRFYVEALWPLDLLVRRAETFNNQCNLGRAITHTQAKHVAQAADYAERQRALLHES